MQNRTPLALALLVGALTIPAGAQLAATETARAKLAAQYGQLELSFEANWGQADPTVRFLARGSGYGLLLTPTEAMLALSRVSLPEEVRERMVLRKRQSGSREFALVRVRVEGADRAAQLLGEELLPGKVNYFSGNDPANWRTDIPTYRKVRVEGVYPGVDLVYYGNQHELEFDFIVAPGASPDAIRLAYEGVEDLRVEPGGDLVLRTKLGELRQHSPSVYQEEGGQLKRIPAAHVLLGAREVGFRVQEYDRRRPLVIDPRLSYSTLLGGGYAEGGLAIAVDGFGDAFVTGLTTSLNFPVVSPYQGSAGPNIDSFVTKLNPTGTALIYSTFFHGTDGDVVSRTIAVDNAGSAYIGGGTTSTTLPVTAGAYQGTTTDTCCMDGFLTKLAPAGSQLAFSTYLAGSQDDEIVALTVDGAGAVHAVGETKSSANFPTTPGVVQTVFSGGSDAFVTKLNATGSALVYSTFLGGTGTDRATAVAVDTSGNAYFSGWTESAAYPTTAGAYQTSGGGRNAFVTKLNSAGTAMVYSSRFGGGLDDLAFGLALDSQGSVYVAGRTQSADFPVTTGAYQATNRGGAGINDGFILKLNPAGSALVYSTYFGGSASDIAWWVAVDSSGNAYVTGQTESSNFPVSADAIQRTAASSQDAFVTKMNSTGTALEFSTYLGGGANDAGYGIALDGCGVAYVVGQTGSADFPTTGSYQTTLKGSQDAFIARIDSAAPGSLTLTSAASFRCGAMAPGMIAVAWGQGFTTGTNLATTTPLPTTLGGVRVVVRDSAGTERPSGLFFTSAQQINFYLATETRGGPATVLVTGSDSRVQTANITIESVNPGLFSMNSDGQGIVAGRAIRVGADNQQTPIDIIRYISALGKWVGQPIDFGGPTDRIFLELYGTGFRNRTSLANVSATIGGIPVQAAYLGAQPSLVGLDQFNVELPRATAGRGDVPIVLTVDGKTANTVTVTVGP